ncbi:hypothetical protein OTK49_01500 [Vibrio coralliirubri]|uniref:DUF7352 domain-containing protein n=1 Tax=Vibrio coralliirubri TaxID=1516159 RepID=UPI002284FF74|nr:hypothetical protein [Vibrio coralliirubri]MCY9861200.1 hypothetical protein [Vibrio coralliirubri]
MNIMIWKYDLKPYCEIELRAGAKILSVGQQFNEVKMWVEVNLDETKTEVRKFALVGTGIRNELNGTEKFLGTVMCHGGSLVLHAYEVLN